MYASDSTLTLSDITEIKYREIECRQCRHLTRQIIEEEDDDYYRVRSESLECLVKQLQKEIARFKANECVLKEPEKQEEKRSPVSLISNVLAGNTSTYAVPWGTVVFINNTTTNLEFQVRR